MAVTREHRNLVVATCPTNCSFNAANIGETKADAIHEAYENGATQRQIVQRAADLGITVSTQAAYRHKKHLRPEEDEETAIQQKTALGEEVDIQEAIEAGLRAALRHSKSWKPSLQEFIKLAELKLKFSGPEGNKEFLELMDSADDEDIPGYTPPAAEDTEDEDPE